MLVSLISIESWLNFDENVHEIVCKRSGQQLKNNALCKSHYHKYVKYFTANERKCCDPKSIHSKPCRKALKVINKEMGVTYNLIPGHG